MMNTITEIITGTPSPPLRIMAPNGAPMKKNMRHDSACVNLFIASILCILMMASPSDVVIARNPISDMADCTCIMAWFTEPSFWSVDILENTESMLNVFVEAISCALFMSPLLSIRAFCRGVIAIIDEL